MNRSLCTKKPLRFLFYTLLTTASCAPAPSADLSVYVQRFYKEVDARHLITKPSPASLEFGTTEKPAVGTCYYKSARIIIDKKYFNTVDDAGREQLVFHEMFHCMFNLDHVEQRPDLMNPSMLYSSVYTKYRTDLLNAVFARIK